MKNQIIAVIACLLFFSSCLYEDKGNYDYDRLPSQIKITNVEKDLGVKEIFVDRIQVSPTIEFIPGETDADFEFAWYRIKSKELVLLSNQKNLDVVVDTKGVVNYRFTAKHKQTGLRAFVDLTCNVISEFERGFYFFKQTADGNTDVDAQLISKAISINAAEYTLKADLIKTITGAHIEGKPINFDYTSFRYHNSETNKADSVNAYFFATDKEIEVYECSGMKHVASYGDLFRDIQPGKEGRDIEGLYSCANFQILISDGGKVRTRLSLFSRFTDYYYGAENIYHKPMLGSNFNIFLLYSESEGRFTTANSTSIKMPVFPDNLRYKVIAGGKEIWLDAGFFPMSGYNYDLLFFGQTHVKPIRYNYLAGQKTAYALFRKRDKESNTLVLAGMGSEKITNPVGSAMQDNFLIDCKDTRLDEATHYAMHMDAHLLYYAYNNNICMYDINKGTETGTLLTPGDEITWMQYIKFESYTPVALTSAMSGLAIATYSAGDDTYKVRIYAANKTTGVIASAPTIEFSGNGKIREVKYVVPLKVQSKPNSGTAFPSHLYY